MVDKETAHMIEEEESSLSQLGHILPSDKLIELGKEFQNAKKKHWRSVESTMGSEALHRQ
jgi:hypothetical protein